MTLSPHLVHFSPARRHRFHLLDGLRGVAALLVVLYHTPLAWRPWFPLHQAWLAVDFFFLLSGFVIALSYQSRLANGTTFRDFAVARLIRLYPLYLAGTALGILSVVVVDSLSAHVTLSLADLGFSLLPALLFLPNFPNHWPQPYCFPFDVPAWSLILELVANFIFAALLRKRMGHPAVSGLLVALSFLILCVAAFHGLTSLDFGSTLSGLPVGLARVGFSFFAGVLIFRIYSARSATLHRIFPQRVFPVAATLGLLAVLVASSPLTTRIAYQLFTIGVVFPLVLYLGACSHVPPVADRVCAFLGDISYPLYILHASIIFPLGGSKPRQFLGVHPGLAPWLLLAVLALLLAFAWFAARYPDRLVRIWLTRHYNAAIPAATV